MASPEGQPAGPALAALGRALVGCLIMRYWPEDHGWWEAFVADHSSTRGHKCMCAPPDKLRAVIGWRCGSQAVHENLRCELSRAAADAGQPAAAPAQHA